MAGGVSGELIDGRFELMERLGSGGMGTVWRARDTVLRREVALKEVRPRGSLDASEDSDASRRLRERVLREARALARFSHPHVVTIHHIVEEDRCPWLVMELLPGVSLQGRLEEGPLTPEEAARLGGQVLDALRTAHAVGVQHRDVKPANVMLRADGDAVLTDFGIAALHDAGSLTATGELIGSPEFIAPERVRGTVDGPEADLWSLGMTLYVCTEGHHPLRRTTGMATLAAVLDEPVPPPERSGRLAPVLNALLVREPTARPSAERLARMLETVAAGGETGAAEAASQPTRTSVSRPPFPTAPPPPPPREPGAAPGDTIPQPPRLPATPPPLADRPGQPGQPRRRARSGRVAVAAATVVALLASGAYLLTRPGDNPNSADRKEAGPSSRTSSPTGAAEDSPSAPRSRGPGSPSAAPPGSPSQSASRSPSATPPEPPGPRAGTWVAQLASVPKSAGVSARAERHARLSEEIPGVRWLDSGDFASLRPGYWMFYRPGPVPHSSRTFADGNAAVAWCRRQGLTSSNACVGRYLSHERSDRIYLCSPDKSHGTGRCTRP